jgi:predicted alpha/beta-hydrolase family hydrolase
MHAGSMRAVTAEHVLEVPTPHGLARAHLHPAPGAAGTVALGHGAGGSVAARDLGAVARAARERGFTVVLVEQPYRVAGRRSPAPARQLDAAWIAVLDHLRGAGRLEAPLIAGGRSSGARVACRTAAATGAAGVVCLAFPLRPPARAGRPPAPSRLEELDAVPVPVLVVQGEADPFGMPAPGPRRRVVAVRGDHRLASDLAALARAFEDWLAVTIG